MTQIFTNHCICPVSSQIRRNHHFWSAPFSGRIWDKYNIVWKKIHLNFLGTATMYIVWLHVRPWPITTLIGQEDAHKSWYSGRPLPQAIQNDGLSYMALVNQWPVISSDTQQNSKYRGSSFKNAKRSSRSPFFRFSFISVRTSSLKPLNFICA